MPKIEDGDIHYSVGERLTSFLVTAAVLCLAIPWVLSHGLLPEPFGSGSISTFNAVSSALGCQPTELAQGTVAAGALCAIAALVVSLLRAARRLVPLCAVIALLCIIGFGII